MDEENYFQMLTTLIMGIETYNSSFVLWIDSMEEMKNTDKAIKDLVNILKKHGAKRIEIFGSFARGEATQESDIDVIVEFKKRKSLLELVGIEQEIEDKLGRKVDLLTEKSISPYLIRRIKKESKVVFC